MAHHKRKRRHWAAVCGLCKLYKRFAGNSHLRRTVREGAGRRLAREEAAAWVR